MTDIWRKDAEKWSRLGPSDFEDEGELHDRILEAPEMLPLSGQPRLAFSGKKVGIGSGEADVLAVDMDGRPTVIEVKLSRNRDSRRAVVAQALAYASWLHGVTVEELEGNILHPHLQSNGYQSLIDAARDVEEGETLEGDDFYGNLQQHLTDGSFRIVFVLDTAPQELVDLTRYLEAITTDKIAVDLVTVSAYEVNGAQILLPQRIDPDRTPETARMPSRKTKSPPVSLTGFRLFGEEHVVASSKDAWLRIAEAMYDRYRERFGEAVGTPLKRRSYVEASENDLREPQQVRDSGYWIEGHGSTEQMKARCFHLLEIFKCERTALELYED